MLQDEIKAKDKRIEKLDKMKITAAIAEKFRKTSNENKRLSRECERLERELLMARADDFDGTDAVSAAVSEYESRVAALEEKNREHEEARRFLEKENLDLMVQLRKTKNEGGSQKKAFGVFEDKENASSQFGFGESSKQGKVQRAYNQGALATHPDAMPDDDGVVLDGDDPECNQQ